MNTMVKTMGMLAVVACTGVQASAQSTANPDYRIRAKFQIPETSTFQPGQSVGNADFRVKSRFSQLYYGGVSRSDDFKFSVSLSFTSASGFPASYAASVFNTAMDMYIDNAFVGRVNMNATTQGVGDLTYDSRHATLPDLPLPANFPTPVSVGQTVRLFAAEATVPGIGAPMPAGQALLEASFDEPFPRGDVNQDNRVDMTDFAFLASNFDPYHRTGLHVGPVAGDFTGDNLCDRADYQIMAQNWTATAAIPAEPAPIVGACPGDINLSGSKTPQDIFDFLSYWFFGDNLGNFNHVNGITVQDIFDFLAAWFAPC